ncbi:Hypp9445 [Branchiostoma lanceolatum]|uniref:Hypp9445 protein n=1 Tax=Branchiostoma lanceolatum TaxID=7740 RepID=A0A8S4MMI8_BRALA|nr:Hypp9445 [Branchiostoma lanceolatum]
MALPTQLFILVASACLLPHSAVALPLSSAYWEQDNDALGFDQDPSVGQGSLGVPPHIASLSGLDGLPEVTSRYSKRFPSHNFPFRTSVGRYGKRSERSRLNDADSDGEDFTLALPPFPENFGLELPDNAHPYDRHDSGRTGDWSGGRADQPPLSQHLKRAMFHLRTNSSRYGRRKRSAE